MKIAIHHQPRHRENITKQTSNSMTFLRDFTADVIGKSLIKPNNMETITNCEIFNSKSKMAKLQMFSCFYTI